MADHQADAVRRESTEWASTGRATTDRTAQQHAVPMYPDQAPRPSRGRRAVILVLCAVLGSAIGVGAQRLTGGEPDARAATPTPTVTPTPVTADVSSFDPAPQGTGFRQQGSSWRTEHYNTASFGNYKKGIGLLLDLGSARAVQAVTLTVQSGPLTIELRAADSKADSANGYRQVGTAVTAKGTTTLPATAGGSHRYWLVWVTSLAPDEGRYFAQIGSVTAKA